MANNIAFQPMGKTYKISAPTANTAVTIAVYADSPSNQYYFSNHEAAGKGCYVRVSTTNVAAVLPDASGQYSILIPPSTRLVFTGPQVTNSSPVYVSMIGENNNSEVYVTPGEGL
jgi:hypothetical protein